MSRNESKAWIESANANGETRAAGGTARETRDRAGLGSAFRAAARRLCTWFGNVLPAPRDGGRRSGKAGKESAGDTRRHWIKRRRVRLRRQARNAPSEQFGEDDSLGRLLGALCNDIQRQAGAAEDSVRAAFAVRMGDAHRSTPKHAVAGALRALRDEQSAALAALARNTAAEIRGRQQAAILVAPRRRQVPRGSSQEAPALQAIAHGPG